MYFTIYYFIITASSNEVMLFHWFVGLSVKLVDEYLLNFGNEWSYW